jgi:hypothetical protein
MGRCAYDLIKKLEPAFDVIRLLDKVKETKPGIFYLKNQGFLHFHEKDNKIWADVKNGVNWGEPIDIPEKISKTFLSHFLLEVNKRHKACLGV